MGVNYLTAMRRRTVLGALSSLSLAGCLRLSSEDESAEGDSSSTGEPAEDDSASTENGVSESSEADIWVAPDDGEGGDGTEANPFRDLQHSLNVAEEGDTIRLKSGDYRAKFSTTSGGEPGNPITLTGPPDAVVRASEGGTTMFGILHSHFHVRGLTFDGLVDPDRMWEDEDAWASDILTVSPGPRYEGGVDYIEDIVFEPHAIGNSANNLVSIERTRDSSFGNFEVIGPAGASYHPKMQDPTEGHSSSIFYVGTSPPTIEEHKPWDSLDRTRDIRIHHVDNSTGYHHSMFSSIRVGTENVTLEYCTDRNSGNETSGQEHVSAISVGGNNCTVRGNDIGDCRYGIEFGAWTPRDLAEAENWARNNDMYRNRLQSVSKDVFAFHETTPEAQRVLCDNRLIGVDTDEYAYATGECDTSVPAIDGIGHTAGQ